MSQSYQKLKGLLMELFQLDQPELDFGIYRIMHARSAEVSQFLDRDLLPQVKQAFSHYKTADRAEIEKELARAIEQAQALGADAETLPKVRDLRARLKDEAVDVGILEREVYDHLYSFFRRYYSDGDFLARRVYKPGVYAIPYEGEEVTLHWANKDQYYIKTSEYLRDYAVRLRPGDDKRPMRFRLEDVAEGEHGNVKAAEGKDRVFVLAGPGESGHDFISEEDGEHGSELVIRFAYRPATLDDWPAEVRKGKSNPPTQKDLLGLAIRGVLGVTDPSLAPWLAELGKPHVKASGEKADYTQLQAHLERYTARNTFDYFIHKDLGGFLQQELDFYIKSEIMHLDDVEHATAPRVEQYLSKIKVIRKVAGKIIDFLAQLEGYQKKLWLKKKFVVVTRWCISVGWIPDSFHSEIAANDAQRGEWVELLGIDGIEGDMTRPGYSVPLTSAFLKAYPTLMIDTRHFAAEFTQRLLESIDGVDESTDGVLFHSENFQALNMMDSRYKERVKSIYIDPPYNTAATEIAYKNGYRHSSWLSLIQNRISRARGLMAPDAVMSVAIDDAEFSRLLLTLVEEFGEENLLSTVVVRAKPQGRAMAAGFSQNHEYAIFVGNSSDITVGRLPRDEDRLARYPEQDEQGIFAWANLRKTGAGSHRAERRKLFYPIWIEPQSGSVKVPSLTWNELDGAWTPTAPLPKGYEVVLPIDDDGTERVWGFGWERAQRSAGTELSAKRASGRWQVHRKYRPHQDGAMPGTWWAEPKYSASESGTKVLQDIIGGDRGAFSYPKSISTVEDCIRATGIEAVGTVLDFFAGSATTAHAVMNLNREDGGRRHFVLVEMGVYFDSVLLPRIKKVSFTPSWKDGKAKRGPTGVEAERGPRIVKVLRLESYEDTLNNLEVHRSDTQQLLLDSSQAQGRDGFKEQYVLRYMLDVETRGSQSLLNVQAFTDPTAYRLKVRRPGSDESREVNVDLLETFNWLIGLTVQHIAAPQTFSAAFERDGEQRLRLRGGLKQEADGPYWFRTITGTMPDGRKALVIWRKLPGEPEQDNLVLDEWFKKQRYSTRDFEFDLVYVNGGNNLPNLKTSDDTWKVRLIEEDFHRLMFETAGA